MKKYLQTIICFLLFFSTTNFPEYIQAQGITISDNSSDSFITIEGTIQDKQSRKKLEYVHISIPGTNIGTITNSEGGFRIKIKEKYIPQGILISHIGYQNMLFPIQKNVFKYKIYLRPSVRTLNDLIVRLGDARYIVEQAIKKIKDNYSHDKNLLTGFYRETAQKKRHYISISEAITQTYKTPYTRRTADFDRVKVLKGRMLLSPKNSDTLAVKLLGGPNISVYGDFVKNPFLIFDEDILPYYQFVMDEGIMLNERQHYTIKFFPQYSISDALYKGTIYIDKESLSFSRAEFELCMDDVYKATNAILRKKPFGLRFKPLELSYLVTYQQRDGITYLNYVRNEIRFKCDWKRRLFSTSYSIVSEMVTTDIEKTTENISHKSSFKMGHSLSDKVTDFDDKEFWGDYNIIEPTESLEHAVHKLKKQHKK